MKALVIGGTGSFGARLCDMLHRDGAIVTVAGRTQRAGDGKGSVKVAKDGPILPYVTLDRDGSLDQLAGYNVIVDAAGPFHAYGTDPYRVARAAIGHGAHYFDLCDNADFCQGIKVLNPQAKAAGVTVASGMSSVPAVSSAVVEALRDGSAPLGIETAILPGNKAPRGRAVVESILNQVGQTYDEIQGGREVSVRSWSDPRRYDVGGIQRQAWRVEVPDQRLFPAHFDCPNVAFRAGLELGVMRYGLGLLSVLRAKLGFGMPRWLVSATMVGAKVLSRFGTDRGGMVVRVDIPQGVKFKRKSWVLRATNGDGPYTPGVAIRAACRDLNALPRGAFPAVALVSLSAIEACFEDLSIETETYSESLIPTFRQTLGSDLDRLPDAVRQTHESICTRSYKGVSSVTRGSGLQARVAALLFGFPDTAKELDVEVIKMRSDSGEVWHRRFGDKTFKSFLRATPHGMTERFGPLTFDLGLKVQEGKLHFPVTGGRAFGIPIPRFLLPQSEATEAEVGGMFHFDVHLKAPNGAKLVHYKGWLKAEENGAAGEN